MYCMRQACLHESKDFLDGICEANRSEMKRSGIELILFELIWQWTYEQSEYVVMKELRKSNNLYEVLKVQKTIAFYNEIVYDK